MSTRSLYPLLLFFLLYRSINDTQQTFWGFTFAEIPRKSTLISQLNSLHFDLQNGWLLLFSSQHDLIFGHIWPLEIMFRPHLACILVQCWQHSPCWTYQVEKWVGCMWDDSAKWRLHSGLLFSRALFCCTETEESLALACSEAGPNSSLPSL